MRHYYDEEQRIYQPKSCDINNEDTVYAWNKKYFIRELQTTREKLKNLSTET